jgi:hypothetical protein
MILDDPPPRGELDAVCDDPSGRLRAAAVQDPEGPGFETVTRGASRGPRA